MAERSMTIPQMAQCCRTLKEEKNDTCSLLFNHHLHEKPFSPSFWTKPNG